ncbi:UNVERIFIED_CONTAM: SgrR family transcriptional regulator [Brevibacillus sp. OAP136]
MKCKEHYLTILLSMPSPPHKGSTVTITVETLADMLFCTTRNVKLIMRKLVEEGLVAWTAGVGRGNPSQMTILRELDEVIDEYFRELLAKGRMKEAIELMAHKTMPQATRERLRVLLDNQFGFQVEETPSSRLDVLRVTRGRKLATLDPAFVFSATEAYFLEQIFDTLLVFDPTKKRFLPSIAHAWESNTEGSQWTFYLRKAVRFHHGRVLTAKDVQYSLERIRTVQSISRWQYEDIERIEVESDTIITFHLRQPNRFFLHYMSSVTMSILPHDVVFDERAIIGTGPFRMTENSKQVLVVEAFDDYFGHRALLDRVESWYMPERARDERQYMLPFADDAHAEQTDQDAYFEYREQGCRYLIFNFKKSGILHQLKFRQAMRIVYDRLALIRDLKGTRHLPADSFLPEKSSQTLFVEQSLEQARALLAESGYNGETLRLYYYDKRDENSDATWLQERCAAIGLSLSLHPLCITTFLDTGTVEDADMMLSGEVLESDVEWGMLRLFKDEGTAFFRFLNESQRELIDTHLHDFVHLQAEKERNDVFDRIEQLVRDELWILYGVHMKRTPSYHRSLNGVKLDSFGWIDFSKLWIKPTERMEH